MKAQLLAVEQADGTFCAHLVDEHSVFVKPLDGTGVDSLHYATAITLLGCSVGELFIDSPDENGSGQILAPRPNVLCIVERNKMKKIGLAARGIHPLGGITPKRPSSVYGGSGLDIWQTNKARRRP